jgi:hypothetical protein
MRQQTNQNRVQTRAKKENAARAHLAAETSSCSSETWQRHSRGMRTSRARAGATPRRPHRDRPISLRMQAPQPALCSAAVAHCFAAEAVRACSPMRYRHRRRPHSDRAESARRSASRGRGRRRATWGKVLNRDAGMRPAGRRQPSGSGPLSLPLDLPYLCICPLLCCNALLHWPVRLIAWPQSRISRHQLQSARSDSILSAFRSL